MKITRWNPIWQVGSLQRQMDDVFAEIVSFDPIPGMDQAADVDIRETAKDIILSARLSGIDPKDIDIQVGSNVVTLTGQQLSETYDGFSRRFSYGSFRQAIALPTQVHSDRVQVNFRQGALILTMPKAGRRIKAMSTWQNSSNRSASSPLSKASLANGVQDQIKALTQSWRKAKHWLGRQLQAAADRLLVD